MLIRPYQPGDEVAQVRVFNTSASGLPAFKPAAPEEVERRYRAGDPDPGSKLYAVDVETDEVGVSLARPHDGRGRLADLLLAAPGDGDGRPCDQGALPGHDASHGVRCDEGRAQSGGGAAHAAHRVAWILPAGCGA